MSEPSRWVFPNVIWFPPYQPACCVLYCSKSTAHMRAACLAPCVLIRQRNENCLVSVSSDLVPLAWRGDHCFPVTVSRRVKTWNRRTLFTNTGLFEMIFGVLTACYTQRTWDRSICIFLFNRTTLQVFVTYLIGALVSRNWRYESEPPLKPSPRTCYRQFGTRLSCWCL